MKLADTSIIGMPNSDLMNMIWGDWNILWYDLRQNNGKVAFVAEKNGKCIFLEWDENVDSLWSITRNVGDIKETLWSIEQFAKKFDSEKDFWKWKKEKENGNVYPKYGHKEISDEL